MLLRRVGVEDGLDGSEERNWFRMVEGEMESWKNCESEMVERAEARWLEKRDSAACLERPMACLDMSSIWRAFLDDWETTLVTLLCTAEEEDIDGSMVSYRYRYRYK